MGGDNTARDSMYSMNKPLDLALQTGFTAMRSKVASRLTNAVMQATALAKLSKKNESYITDMLSTNVKQFDLRQVVFASLYRVGFDLHELSFEEKQYMEVIQLYPFFKNGEIWTDIKEELEDLNCQPCGDDAHWMETIIEETQEQAIQAAVL